MTAEGTGTVERMLIISPKAGSMTPEVMEKLHAAFSDFEIVEFNPKVDFRERLAPKATVVVAGGDGTIGFVARALVDSDYTLGLLSLGTFNNFAKALRMPADIDEAIATIKSHELVAVTVGRINGTPFLEAAAVGLFGEAIALGEAAKDFTFGELSERFKSVVGAPEFGYRITGDITEEGRALSLVFANTPSTGASLPVAGATPIEPDVHLSVHAGESRSDIVGRFLAATFLDKHAEPASEGRPLKRVRIETDQPIGVYADNAQVGETPCEVTADFGALKMIVPARVAAAGETPKN